MRASEHDLGLARRVRGGRRCYRGGIALALIPSARLGGWLAAAAAAAVAARSSRTRE